MSAQTRVQFKTKPTDGLWMCSMTPHPEPKQPKIEFSQHAVSSLLIFLDHIQPMLPQGEANRLQDWIVTWAIALDATHRQSLDRVIERGLSRRQK